MRFILAPVAILFIPDFAQAGATHGWCENKELPGIRVCQDQTENYVELGGGTMVSLKFAGYGEDRSVVHYATESGSFRLVTREWGRDRFLINSQGEIFQLQCGDHSHGLCPL